MKVTKPFRPLFLVLTLFLSGQTRTPTDAVLHKMKILSGSSEIAANVVENPLEASAELGAEVALSGSQNDATGAKLMAKHLGSLKHLSLKPGEKKAGSAFFKPIGLPHAGEGATDELKLGAAENVTLFKPTPTICLNDAELHLSPMSPRQPYTTGVTGFANPTDPSDEVRAIFEGKTAVASKEKLETQSQGHSSRESPSSGTRRNSICQLQRLQQHMMVPRLGGKVIVHHSRHHTF